MPFDESKTPELRAPEQNQFLAEVARYLSAIEGGIDKYAELPLDLLLPVSSEFVEKLSYGDPLFRMAPKGTGSRIPQTTDREYLMDALFGAGMVSPAARGAKGVAKSALSGMGRARRAPGEGQMATDELSSILNALDQQRAQQFAKGGVVDLLAQTLLGKSKAKATKDAPDPSRRAAIGLPKDATLKPGEVVVKEEVKKSPKKGETTASITEAMNVPMSRRDVLRAGVGQAIQAAAPRGAMGALMKAAGSTPTSVAKEVVKAAPLSPTTFAGIVAQGLKKNKSNKQIAKSYLKSTGQDLDPDFIEELAEYDVERLRDPFSVFDTTDELYAPGPLDVLNTLLNRGSDEPLRKTLREIKAVNPDLYKELIESARQIDMDIAENAPAGTFRSRLQGAQDRAAKLGVPFDEAKFREYYGYEDDYNPTTLFDEFDDKEFGGGYDDDYAKGGMVGQPQVPKFGKGGMVDLLAQTLLGKSQAKPTKVGPDPSRRAVIGMPKDVTPKSETTTSVTEAMNVPMSRRDFMRAGAGQAVSAMAPRGALGALMKAAASPSDLMEQVGKTDMGGGTGIMTIPGAIAKAMAMGLDEDQTIDMLKRMNLADESDVMYNLPVMANPLDFQVNIGDEFKSMGPREALGQMIGTGSGLDIRKSLREIMRENPDLYDQLKEVARDISDLSTEP